MYLASAVLKRFENQGSPAEDRPFLDWSCQYALYTIQESFYGLLNNFPNRYAAWLIRRIIFPLGKAFLPPDDRSDHKVAELLLSPSVSRERLTEGIHVPVTTDESLGLIEDALKKVIAAESVEKKVRKAVKKGVLKRNTEEEMLSEAIAARVISYDEALLVRAATAARREVISVDDFSQDKREKDINRLVKSFSYH
jgi:acyl-CoA dehydrogenase